MSKPVLVCFAVPQEAKPFLKLIGQDRDVRVLVTGMGARNAERSLLATLGTFSPRRVFTCGFAGALDPALQIGDVVCEPGTVIAGVRSVQFTCTERVAVTVAEKSALRASSGADAVEMESAVITRLCVARGLSCATVRVISDTAHEDLPLDFNSLLTKDDVLSPAKLALALLKAPQRIPALMRLGRNSALAAGRLAKVLHQAVR